MAAATGRTCSASPSRRRQAGVHEHPAALVLDQQRAKGDLDAVPLVGGVDAAPTSDLGTAPKSAPPSKGKVPQSSSQARMPPIRRARLAMHRGRGGARLGQGEDESRALAQGALHPDAPAVRLDDGPGDHQAQAGARRPIGALARAVEALEDALLVLGAMPTPSSLTRTTTSVSASVTVMTTLPAGVAELDGVADEVVHHLHQPPRVRQRHRGRLGLGRDVHAGLLGSESGVLHAVVHDLGHVHALVQLEVTRSERAPGRASGPAGERRRRCGAP